MTILLIRPKPDPRTIGLQHIMLCEPLELEYLCAAIADLGHETVIVDMILERNPIDYFIKRYQPDVVGMTAYITHIDVVKHYCRTIKHIRPECHTVVGGVHAEVVPEDFRDDAIDFIVCGNPLATFRRLIKAIGNHSDTRQLSGIWSPASSPCTKETQFDFPAPDRSKVARYRSKYYYLFHNPCALIKTSFGCPYDCSFCFCRNITGGAYFTRNMDSVITELASIPEHDIYIVDDNFLVSRRRVLEFCQRLRDEHIHKKFLIYGRADFIAQNEDVIREFKQMGLRAVIVGLESYDTDELTLYNKRSDATLNEAAVRILARYNIDCYATLILGTDWDKTDFERLYRWLKKLNITFINLQPFTPLPGTALFEQYEQSLIVPRSDHAKWDLAHLILRPTRLSVAAYYWQILQLYYRITIQPKNLLRLLFKYGLRENINMLVGSTRVALQYYEKIFESLKF
ncbi:cobalamin-dependent protein [candidate division KSB1 bacterium]|nr:cobalamin-dependent protein [candidate division KSB1 bacterium]